jgi:hypothetical protein
MTNRWLPTILYGLLTIWTGLWRNIEAQAYKANALWFCLVMGLVAIAAGFLYRIEHRRVAAILAAATAAIVLGFYFHCFVTKPQSDATMRVGLIILASLAELVVVFLPAAPHRLASRVDDLG